MDDLLNASDSAVTSFLYRRTGAICTMCGEVMAEGYCSDINCSTYPATLAKRFINKFRKAIANFRKKPSLKFAASTLVSGGQFESKRRKH